jgi:hypothetical protein
MRWANVWREDHDAVGLRLGNRDSRIGAFRAIAWWRPWTFWVGVQLHRRQWSRPTRWIVHLYLPFLFISVRRFETDPDEALARNTGDAP